MKKMKQRIALFCAVAFMLALSACGGAKESKEDIAKRLADAETKVAEAQSMQADLVMNMDMTLEADGQSHPMNTKTNMTMLLFNHPMKMKLDMSATTEQSGTEAINMTMYMVEKDGTYTMYAYDGTKWNSQTVDISSLQQFDPQATMGLYLKSAESFEAKGEETINGVKTKKYTGVITNEAMNEVMSATGIPNSMNGLGLPGMDWNAIYKDMGNLPISLWLNEEGYPVRYELDMTEMMNKLYAKLMQQVGEDAAGGTITCSKVLVTMDITNYNQVQPFELPAGIPQ